MFDFEFIDRSLEGEMKGTNSAEQRRLGLLGEQLRKWLAAKALERAFASCVASLQETITGVVAIDGKTLRGSKQDDGSSKALNLFRPMTSKPF